MTTEGWAKTFASSGTSATIDMAAHFSVINVTGQKINEHAGFWVSNTSVTATEILWFRLDATAAVVGADDNYILRPGERCYIRKSDFVSYIAAAGIPGFFVGGDMGGGMVYS